MSAARALVREHPRRLFASLALLALLVELAVVQSAGFARRPGLIGTAVTLDLVVLVPALWAWLGVRRGGAPGWSLVPVVVASTAATALLLPPSGEVLLDKLLKVAPLLELAVLAWLALRARRVLAACRASSTPDALARFREGITHVFGDHPGFRVLADELSMLRYLTVPPADRLPGDARSFSYHRTSGWGAVVAALTLAVAAEATAVHALVSGWSPTAAWILTALSIYSGLWLISDWRATRHRPLLVDGDQLWLRAGLRWTAAVPVSRVVSSERVQRWRNDGAGEGETASDLRLDLPVLGGVDLVLTFDGPLEVHGPFGLTRRVDRVGVVVDDVDGLTTALGRPGGARRDRT